MEFIRSSESVFSYMENGEKKERIDMVQFDLKEGDEPRGNVYVYADHAEIRLTVGGFDSIEAAESKAKQLVESLDK